MKRIILLFLCFLIMGFGVNTLYAAEDGGPATQVEVDGPAEVELEEIQTQDLKVESSETAEKCEEPAPVAECKTCPEPKPCPTCPEPKQCPSSVELKSSSILLSPDKEAMATTQLDFLRNLAKAQIEAGKKADKKILPELIKEFNLFMEMYRELPMSAEALLLKSQIYHISSEKRRYESELIAIAKLLYEYPESDFTKEAVIKIRGLFIKELKRDKKENPGFTSGAKDGKWPDRFAQLIEQLSTLTRKDYRPLVLNEMDEFLMRYPNHVKAEKVLSLKSENYMADKSYGSAALTLSKLISLYPDSDFRSTSLFNLAGILEKNLKDYESAVSAYMQVVEEHPKSKETIKSYQQAAVLYDKKLKDYGNAIKTLESIVSKYPDTEDAMNAFLYISTIHHKSTKQYQSSIDALLRAVDMFGSKTEFAIESLNDAASIASKSLKDYEVQISIQERLVKEYPDSEEAAIALFAIAETHEKKLKDNTKAIAAYQKLIEQYPSTKQGISAEKKVQKLLSQ